MSEIEWRPVVALEDRYDISNNGQVRSWRWKKGMTRDDGNPKMKSLHSTAAGYIQVKLYDGNRNFTAMISRLVAEAFIGPIPPGMDVHHKDNDKSNNTVGNLQIVTRHHNIAEAIRTGVHSSCEGKRRYGEASAFSTLSDTQVMWLRQLANSGYSRKDLAQIFNVSIVQVGRIINKESRNKFSKGARDKFLGERQYADVDLG